MTLLMKYYNHYHLLAWMKMHPSYGNNITKLKLSTFCTVQSFVYCIDYFNIKYHAWLLIYYHAELHKKSIYSKWVH